MAENQIDVKFGGDSAQAQKATADLAAALKASVDQMNNSLSAAMAGFDKFKGVLVTLTAVLAGGKMFKDSIAAANEWNLSVGKLAKLMGTTTEKASVLAVALNHLGVSTDTMSSASMMMSRQLSTNEEAFKTLGIETRNTSTGAFRPAGEIMVEVNEKLKSIKNITEQNVAGMKVYGRGWAELKPILKLNEEAMAEAEETAKRLHLIVGQEGVEASKNYKAQLRDIELVTKSLEVQVGNHLLPVMTKLGAWLGGEGQTLTQAFAYALERVIFAAQFTWVTVRYVVDYFSGLAARFVTSLSGMGEALTAFVTKGSEAAKAVLERNAAELRAIREGQDEELKKSAAQLDSLVAQLGKPLPKPKVQGGGDDAGPHFDFSKPKDSSQDKRFQEWKNQLEQMKEAEGNFFKTSLSEDEAYWQGKLAGVKGSGEKEKQLRRQIEHELYSIHKQQAMQQRQLEEEGVANTKKIASDEVAVKKEALRTKKELGQITEREEIAEQIKLADEEYQIELKALDDKIKLYDQDLVAKTKLENEKSALLRKHALETKKLNDDVLISEKKSIDSMLAPITSAIEKSVTGMIQGTLTLKKALANLFTSILGEFVSMCAKMAAKWAATELLKTGISKEQNIIRTMLEKVGLIETTAAQTTASATTVATKQIESKETIPAEAAVAASGAASAVASIPYVGPALAAAAYAETFAMCMAGMAGFAVGSWEVPGDAFTKIHKGEMIVPAQFAENIRDGGRLGSGGDTHLHVHAVDSASVERLFRDNGHLLAKELRRQSRNFSPTKA